MIKLKRYFAFMLSVVLCFDILFFAGCAKHPDCNVQVIKQMSKKNIYLPDASANEISYYLKNSDRWKLIPRDKSGKPDHFNAHKAARAGHTVLAVYNTGNEESGHVAILNGKKDMFWSSKYNAYVPYAYGSVKGSKPKTIPLSYQFSYDKEPMVDYYIYK